MCRDLCRACGQPLPNQERGGVYLPPRKVMIYDTIKRFPGITAEGVQANCTPYQMSLPAIRVHINQTNDMLAATDLRIKYRDGYRIVLQDS